MVLISKAKYFLLLISCVLLIFSWVSIFLSVKSGIIAIFAYRSIPQALLDAGLGYWGLLSFGLSSIALSLLTCYKRTRGVGSLAKLLLLTFSVSFLLFLPTLFASLLYLMSWAPETQP